MLNIIGACVFTVVAVLAVIEGDRVIAMASALLVGVNLIFLFSSAKR